MATSSLRIPHIPQRLRYDADPSERIHVPLPLLRHPSKTDVLRMKPDCVRADDVEMINRDDPPAVAGQLSIQYNASFFPLFPSHTTPLSLVKPNNPNEHHGVSQEQ